MTRKSQLHCHLQQVPSPGHTLPFLTGFTMERVKVRYSRSRGPGFAFAFRSSFRQAWTRQGDSFPLSTARRHLGHGHSSLEKSVLMRGMETPGLRGAISRWAGSRPVGSEQETECETCRQTQGVWVSSMEVGR